VSFAINVTEAWKTMRINLKELWVTLAGVTVFALGLSGVRGIDPAIDVAMLTAVVVLSVGVVRAEIRGRSRPQ
jgi:carbon monoxide dehydrogenase subunit G